MNVNEELEYTTSNLESPDKHSLTGFGVQKAIYSQINSTNKKIRIIKLTEKML